ncbi:HAMP domain-containing histidine kinase [Clostridium estertheticum]|nr:HAMP domain-containing sensor histidine kinase [Clostridium estertheticum]MBX4264960.1 HAMP domain-containing histidine kinase [Clostridium estertheticum]WLC90931.1 HAMP domain-containing histidine kinase [Clostridium estertheticum]
MLALSNLSVMDIIKNKNYLRMEPYFTSSEFKAEIIGYFNNIEALNIIYKDYSHKSDDEKVTNGEIMPSKTTYDANLRTKEDQLSNKYKNDLLAAEKKGNNVEISRLTDAKDKELNEFKKENEKTLDNAKKKIALYKNQDYENIKRAVEGKTIIKYYITKGKNNVIYTNIVNVSDINLYVKNNAFYSMKFPDKSLNFNKDMFTINQWVGTSGEAYFIIPKDIDKTSYIYENYNYYNSVRQRIIKEVIIGFVAFIIGIILIFILKKNKEQMPFLKKLKKWYNKIPLDVRIFLFMIYYFIMTTYIDNVPFFYKPYNYAQFLTLTIMAFYMLYCISNLIMVYGLYKNREEFREQVKKCAFYQLSKRGFIILTMFAGVAIFVAYSTFMVSSRITIIPIMYILCYFVFIFIYSFNKIRFLRSIIKGTEKIVSGNLNYTIVEKGRGDLFKLAHNINNMKAGFQKSLENEIKSERLKSELITNVSHDLKTPLTSIINYVDFLKKEGLSKEESQGYIDVLDRKSQRLKILIDDLFEASKMASGAVELNIEKVDITALLQQSLAELHDKISNSSLIFKVKVPKQKIYANLDGKKTWRVFENLINNILKYTLPKTRVYIDLIERDNQIIINMKNISAYEMDFDNEEIFERFIRGDKSRNTEGSGLGLSIAKSIIELQGGRLSIEIDGDLFKAKVIIPSFSQPSIEP